MKRRAIIGLSLVAVGWLLIFAVQGCRRKVLRVEAEEVIQKLIEDGEMNRIPAGAEFIRASKENSTFLLYDIRMVYRMDPTLAESWLQALSGEVRDRASFDRERGELHVVVFVSHK